LFLDPTAATTATFLRQDATTQGNWMGTYGAQGYDVIDGSSSLPSYASVTPSGQANTVWASPTTDPRALQTSAGSSRIPAPPDPLHHVQPQRGRKPQRRPAG